ncbi:MAG: hypothetical protein MMC33_010006 [Icmadophila ericetorum]|nr:hypothetical protein [Icmadophila ericetorum]
MSETSTSTIRFEDPSDSFFSSGLLSSSIVSSPFSKRTNNLVSKIYKQASTLFLTRRLPEAFSTIKLIISASQSPESVNGQDKNTTAPAPVAGASRSLRVKVWNLYLALVNAIIELGPEDGKTTFGSQQWRSLLVKAQDGTIWEDIVRIGYGGAEGNVDAEVVINIATLLLAQSPSQTLNQQRLESYLSESTQPEPTILRGFRMAHQGFREFTTEGADETKVNSLRDLNSRLKILEIFTLHVLPRNEEWQYAKEFVSMNELLDEDKREVFLQTLQGLQDDKKREGDYELSVLQEEEERLRRGRELAEQQWNEQAKAEQQGLNGDPQFKGHKRTDSEKDYGIEDPQPNIKPFTKLPTQNGPKKDMLQHSNRDKLSSPTHRVPSSKSKPVASMYMQGVALVSSLKHLIINMTQSASKNPMVLMRTILFVMGLIFALTRQNVRERIIRLTGQGWNKLKGTVGMGVKISYL